MLNANPVVNVATSSGGSCAASLFGRQEVRSDVSTQSEFDCSENMSLSSGCCSELAKW